jgi:hypothetical protein
MPNRRLVVLKRSSLLVALVLACVIDRPVEAVPPSPIVSSLFVAIEDDIIEPGTSNLLHLAGEVHVITHVAFSDAGVPSVGIWANLVRVRGTSETTGITYLGVGAGNTAWVGISPGPPNVPSQGFDLSLVSLATAPGARDTPPNPVLPVFLRNFQFGAENTNFGELQSVDASFEP